jgi:hypothetical protein
VSAIARGIARAMRSRWRAALLTIAAVLALDVLLPPLVLSLVRTPWTYFTWNPWLKQAPAYLASDRPWAEKLDFVWQVALFWFAAEGPYGQSEWGFVVDARDVARFLLTALLIGVYVALWLEHRAAGVHVPAARAGGAVGAFASVLGLSTGPCSVVGCGAPVLPVLGLVFAGLSSTALALLSLLSRVSVVVVVGALVIAVMRLGRQAGVRAAGPGSNPAPAATHATPC